MIGTERPAEACSFVRDIPTAMSKTRSVLLKNCKIRLGTKAFPECCDNRVQHSVYHPQIRTNDRCW